jgi:23S rRNA (guanosine2251-2'-O)-methyltransferase
LFSTSFSRASFLSLNRVESPNLINTKPTAIRTIAGAASPKSNKSGKMLNMCVVYQIMEKVKGKNNSDKNTGQKLLILPDIRSVINVGAIFRTADAIGIDKIYLSGYTPAPVDRFGRKRSDFAKAALGAEDSVDWEQAGSVSGLIESLKSEGVKIIALEQGEDSVDYKGVSNGLVNIDIESARKVSAEDVAVILGNEVEGISEEVLSKADVVAEIPMFGEKESLNISVAAGIFLFRLFDK